MPKVRSRRVHAPATRSGKTGPAIQAPSPGLSFEDDVAACVPAIQDLLVRVLETHCGEGPTDITTICDRLGVHRKLAWQVRNVAYSPAPLRAVSFMPSRAGIDTLIQALERKGAGRSVAPALRAAADSFSRMTAAHASDRASLELLAQSQLAHSETRAELRWREKAFLGNSFIWGAQAKLQLAVTILHRSTSREDWLDVAQIRGLIGLTRVRPDVHWVMSQSVVLKERRRVETADRRPLDEEAARGMGGVPILPAFCSKPPPRLRRRLGNDGLLNDELLPAPVGFSGQQTVFTGEVIRELAPAYAIEEHQRAHFGAASRTPSEVLLFDHFVHRDLFPGVKRQLCVFSELNASVTMAENDLLPVGETLEHPGRGPGAARTAEVPGYLDLLRWVFGRLGWAADDFELYRARLAYPPIPTSVMIRHDLPPRASPDHGPP
jgi:hypothetical protein